MNIRRLFCTGQSNTMTCEKRKKCENYQQFQNASIGVGGTTPDKYDDFINVDRCAGNRSFPFTNFKQEQPF